MDLVPIPSFEICIWKEGISIARYHRLTLEIIQDKLMSRKKNLFIFKSTYILCIYIYSKAITFYQFINYLEKKSHNFSNDISEHLWKDLYKRYYSSCLKHSTGNWCFTCTLLQNKVVCFSPQIIYLPSINHYKHYTYSLREKKIS